MREEVIFPGLRWVLSWIQAVRCVIGGSGVEVGEQRKRCCSNKIWACRPHQQPIDSLSMYVDSHEDVH